MAAASATTRTTRLAACAVTAATRRAIGRPSINCPAVQLVVTSRSRSSPRLSARRRSTHSNGDDRCATDTTLLLRRPTSSPPPPPPTKITVLHATTPHAAALTAEETSDRGDHLSFAPETCPPRVKNDPIGDDDQTTRRFNYSHTFKEHRHDSSEGADEK